MRAQFFEVAGGYKTHPCRRGYGWVQDPPLPSILAASRVTRSCGSSWQACKRGANEQIRALPPICSESKKELTQRVAHRCGRRVSLGLVVLDPEKKGSHIMLKHMVRWIVVIATLLIIATALVMTPLMSHAAGTTHTHKPTQTSAATATPTSTTSGGTMQPDFGWSH